MSSVDSKGLNYQDCEVLFRVNKQSTNITDSVRVDKDDLDDDAHLRHARDETENAEFLTGSMATRLHVPVVTRRTTAAAQHRSTQQQHWHSNQQYNYHRKQWQQAGQTEEEGKEEKGQGEREKGRMGERGKEEEGRTAEEEGDTQVKKDVTDWVEVRRRTRRKSRKMVQIFVKVDGCKTSVMEMEMRMTS